MTIGGPESSVSSDSNALFGKNEALWVYRMAASMSTESLHTRTIEERASDAVRTAIRHHDRSDVDVDIAIRALLDTLIEEVS